MVIKLGHLSFQSSERSVVVVLSNLQPSVMTQGIAEWHGAARRNGRFSQIGPEGWIGRF
jgi:hypothetical protein